jgi:hypothetical protein
MTHSKDLGTLVATLPGGRHEDASGVAEMLVVWGPLIVPVLRDAPARTLVEMTTRAIASLAQLRVLSPDESTELQGRMQALTVLATVSDAVPVSDASASSLHAALTSTLPDPSLVTSWNVLATAVVTSAAVLAEMVVANGAAAGAEIAVAAWPQWTTTAAVAT